MKTKINVIFFLILIISPIYIFAQNVNFGFITNNSYENDIKSKGKNIVELYMKQNNVNYIEGTNEYNDFINKITKRSKFNPLNNNEDKIIYEYERILNDKPDFGKTTIENPNLGKTTVLSPVISSYKVVSISGLLALTSYYNRTSAVNYAYNWVFKRNTNYSFYSGLNNCTNFTSQVLNAGYIPYKVDGILGKYDNSNWYYTSTDPSWTWGGAQNFKQHATTLTSRYSLATYFSDLQVGDIIQADWDKNGSVDHSMVVTKKLGTSTSQIYLTYNNEYNIPSNDKKDVQLSTILASWPNSYYYGWKVIY